MVPRGRHVLQPSDCYTSPSTSSAYLSTRTPSPHTIYCAEPCLSDDERSMHSCPFNIETCTGCIENLSTAGSDYGSETSRSASCQFSLPDRAQLQLPRQTTPTSSIVSLGSAAANRAQLKEQLLHLYFPASLIETDFMYTNFLSRESLAATGPTIDAAVDSLALMLIGTSRSNERLIVEAQNRHSIAIESLNLDMTDQNAVFDEGVLGAIYILGFCEIFWPSSSHAQQRRTHHNGLGIMLLTRGPDRKYSKYGQLLLYNFRHLSAIVGSAERKRIRFANKFWKRCAAVTDGLMSSLTEQILHIPEVLEKADAAMGQSRPDAAKMFGSLFYLADAEKKLQIWLLDWYRSFDGLPYRTELVEKFPDFWKHGGNTSNIFPKALRYPSFSHASAHTSYWVALLQLKQTMLDVNRRYRTPVLPKSEAILLSEANECAALICESIAYVMQDCFGYCGLLLAGDLLQHALRWYNRTRHTSKAEWCRLMSESLGRMTNMTQCVSISMMAG